MNIDTQKSDLENAELQGNNTRFFIKNNISTFLDIVSFISLSLVVFGILTLGFLVAPIIFKNLEPRSLASGLMTDIFLRFYPFAFTCILITVGVEILRFILKSKELIKSKLWLLQFLIVVTVAILTGYSNFILLPEINDMRIHQKGPTLWTNNEFVIVHKRSESFAKAIFALGLIPLCLMVSLKKKN